MSEWGVSAIVSAGNIICATKEWKEWTSATERDGGMEIFRFRLTVYNGAYDTFKYSLLKSKNVWQMYGDFDGYKYIVCTTEQGVQCTMLQTPTIIVF